MADANPVNTTKNSTLPPGNGHNLMKTRCPKCDAKYGYWLEDGDPGCPECEVREAGEINKKAAEEREAAEKKVFDDAVKAEVAKQLAGGQDKPSTKKPATKKPAKK